MDDGLLPRVIKNLDIISNNIHVLKVTRTCNVSDIRWNVLQPPQEPPWGRLSANLWKNEYILKGLEFGRVPLLLHSPIGPVDWLTFDSSQIIVTNITNSTPTATSTSTGDLVFGFTRCYGPSRWCHRSLGRYGTSRHGSKGQLLFPRCIHFVYTWNRSCTPFSWALT